MFLLRGNGGIQAVVDAIGNLINFIEVLWNFVTNMIKSLITALAYIATLVPKVSVLIATLPSWLLAFASITLGVSVAYIIVGRNGGKTD